MDVVLGILFTALFASGQIAQIIRLHKRKIAEDISLVTYMKWMIGFVLAAGVAVRTEAHWVFSFGYILQGFLTLYTIFQILHYRHECEFRMKRIRTNVMTEAKESCLKVFKGGKV